MKVFRSLQVVTFARNLRRCTTGDVAHKPQIQADTDITLPLGLTLVEIAQHLGSVRDRVQKFERDRSPRHATQDKSPRSSATCAPQASDPSSSPSPTNMPFGRSTIRFNIATPVDPEELPGARSRSVTPGTHHRIVQLEARLDVMKQEHQEEIKLREDELV